MEIKKLIALVIATLINRKKNKSVIYRSFSLLYTTVSHLAVLESVGLLLQRSN